jgi:hypothetical protein
VALRFVPVSAAPITAPSLRALFMPARNVPRSGFYILVSVECSDQLDNLTFGFFPDLTFFTSPGTLSSPCRSTSMLLLVLLNV